MRIKSWLGRRRRAAARPPRPAADVAAWLRDRTFHHSQFSDLRRLAAEKERQGVSISLCIPTLNEEPTIGKEVTVFKSELMSRYPLVDEIVVMDSGSTDRTCEVARAFGAEACLASDILPELGPRQGKGENLWKAVYQLKGDILVFVDADISNIHARFAYGLLAPLLLDPNVQYVKAFYDRPLVLPKGVRASGGGRVTEILVRPLFSLFAPDLTAIVQPLSGEYAARRGVLEAIPFPTGYGVEIAHLMDIHRGWGLDAFAQTDLDRRVHRNQSTQALGRMAFGILRTFLKRVSVPGLEAGPGGWPTVLRQFQARDLTFEQIEFECREDERPPLRSLPQYQARFGRTNPG